MNVAVPEAGVQKLVQHDLRAISGFRDLPPAVLQRVLSVAQWRRYRRGDVLFHEGSPVTSVFLLNNGRVKIYTVTDDGREQLLHLLAAGAVFPRVGLFVAGEHPATAVMDQEGVVGTIQREAVLELARTDGEMAVALLGMMEGVVRYLQERIRTLALQDVKSRVLQLLMRTTETGRDLTHQEIAGFVGAARETVSRAIADLRRQGINIRSLRR